MGEDRLDWIERWATGWKECLAKNPPSILDPRQLPLQCAVDMILELIAAAKDA